MINLTREMQRALGKAWRAGLPLWQHNGFRHWPLTGPLPPDAGTRKCERRADNAHNGHKTRPPPCRLETRPLPTGSAIFCLFIPAPGGIVGLKIKTSDMRGTSRSPRVSEVFLLFIQCSSLRLTVCVLHTGMRWFSNRLPTHTHTHSPSIVLLGGKIIWVSLSLDTVSFSHNALNAASTLASKLKSSLKCSRFLLEMRHTGKVLGDGLNSDWGSAMGKERVNLVTNGLEEHYCVVLIRVCLHNRREKTCPSAHLKPSLQGTGFH